MIKYGYARVSTAKQLDQNGLEVQIKTLEEKGCTVIFQEQYSGKNNDRPKFNEMMSMLQRGDYVVFTKLDRMARSTEEGLNVVKELLKKGVTVEILNMMQIFTPANEKGELPYMTKAFLTMALAFAEMERTMIVERMAEGKALAKASNPDFKEGRKATYSESEIAKAVDMRQAGMTYDQIRERTGISKPTVYRALQKRIKTHKELHEGGQ